MPDRALIERFKRLNILVIGDLILDQYIRGSVSRISPEAPVPVVLQKEDSTFMPGGASNVANNLRSLGARVTIAGKVGADTEGRHLKSLLKNKGIDVRGVFVDAKIPTPLKTRVIAQHQQVVRVDRERMEEQSHALFFSHLKKFVSKNIRQFDAVIISDYGKGTIVPDVIKFVCRQTRSHKKIVTVDPKVEHFDSYRRVTAITPNKSEMENAIRYIKIKDKNGHRLNIYVDQLKSIREIDQAGAELLKHLNLECLLITLGEHGMRVYEKGKQPAAIATRAKEVFDVTGAGDTVIAVFTLALAAGAGKKDAAELANLAAGIVVGKMGAVAVTQLELQKAVGDALKRE